MSHRSFNVGTLDGETKAKAAHVVAALAVQSIQVSTLLIYAMKEGGARSRSIEDGPWRREDGIGKRPCVESANASASFLAASCISSD